MKSDFKRFLLLLAAVFLVACSQSESSVKSGSFQAWLPWSSGDGSYSLTPVTLLGITDLSQAQGQFAQFYISPGISKTGEKLVGERPQLNYFVSNKNQLFPQDQLTAEILTIYAHLQRLKKMDRQLGRRSSQRPISVGVSVKYLDQGHLVKNNAMFVGAINSLLFVPYTLADLPISINAGVIAHEYFHSIFYQEVTSQLSGEHTFSNLSNHDFSEISAAFPKLRTLSPLGKAEELALYQQMLLRGFNEGLADYWGWLYSQDVNFVSRSLSQEGEERSLEVGPKLLSQREDLEDWVRIIGESRSLTAASYKLGTEIARTLKTATAFSGEKTISQSILRNLHLLPNIIWQAQQQETNVSPSDLLILLVSEGRQLSQGECAYWKKHLLSSGRGENVGFDSGVCQ